MAIKRNKIIALVASGVLISSTLATASAIVLPQLIESAKLKAKNSAQVAADSDFKWDKDHKIIYGFRDGIKTSEIEALLSSGTLIFPECEEIAENSFDYAFEDITTPSTFTIKFNTSTRVIGAKAFHGNSKLVGYDKNGTGTWALSTIGKCAFDKTGLTKAIIPATCDNIGERAFYKCKSLSEIDLQDRTNLISQVGSHAFQGISETGNVVTSTSMTKETASAIAANLSTIEQGQLHFDTTANAGWKINNGSIVPMNTIPPIYLNVDENNKLKAGLKRGSIDDYQAIFIPQNVVEIGNNAFAENETLTSLAWEKDSKCAKIGQRAFYECKNICKANTNNELAFPAAVTYIGWQAFMGCDQIQKLNFKAIEFGNRARTFTVGTEAFKDMKEFTGTVTDRVVFPTAQSGGMTDEQIRSMFTNSLISTGDLNSTWIDTGIKPIDASYVEEHTKTDQIQIEGDENYYYSITGFDWPEDTGTSYNALVFDTDESVISIADGAFWDEVNQKTKIPDSITRIDMSNTSLKKIGDNAFRGAKSLTTVALSDKTETIGAGAFEDCKNLEGITLPASLKTIGASAFQGCDNAFYLDLSHLTNAQLEEIVKAYNNGENPIGENAFKDFGVMKETGGSIWWPEDIDAGVKSSIVDILVEAGLPESWVKEETSKEGYTGGIPVTYNGNVILNITEDEVAGTAVLESINWTNLDIYIKDLEDTTGITLDSLSLIIPKYVTSIGENFWGSPTSSNVSKVNKLSFAANSRCKAIGDNAFKNASQFTGSLTLPETIKTIGASAFEGCSGFNGTLKLPASLSISPAGIGAYAFKKNKFTIVNTESWDSTYISSWDTVAGNIPVGDSCFDETLSTVVVVANDMISSEQLETLKNVLSNPGKLSITSFGENLASYTSKVPAASIDSILAAHPELKTVDDDTKKEMVLDTYIEWINDGVTISGKKYTGKEILTNDLMLTFKAAAINSPELAASKQSVFVDLTNVEAHGPSISFDATFNINVYSETYELGYVVQLSTSVKNLKLTSVCDYATTDINQTAKEVGIKFTSSEDTVLNTAYDKQYVYTIKEDGSQYRKTVVDTKNTSASFYELETKFRDALPIASTETAASRLHTLARETFLAAPSLFGAILGAYDYTKLYNLNNGCDETGMLYTPYMTTFNESDEVKYSYVPINGKIKSAILSNFNIYSTDVTDERFENASVWQTNVMNFSYKLDQHAQKTMTLDQIISTYGQYVSATSGSFTAELGQRFREDMLYSVAHAMQGIVSTYKSKCKYIENSSIKFIKLDGKPVISVVDGKYVANCAMVIDLYLHDDQFVENGKDTEGKNVSGYKNSVEVHIPIQFNNVVLNGAYQSTIGTTGMYWSIFNTSRSIVDNSSFETFKTYTLSDGTIVGPYMRILEFDEATQKFSSATIVEAIKKNTFADVWTQIKDLSMSDIQTYVSRTWPLLSRVQLLDVDNDGASTHISLRHNTKYLEKIIWG